MERALMLWQAVVVLGTAAGWGHWLWRIAGRPPAAPRMTWLWCGLGGFCAQALVLQSLVYLDLPLSWTAWAGLIVGVAGIAAALKHRPSAKPCGYFLAGADVRMIAGVFAVVFAMHAFAPAWVEPQRYFGNAHYDQANYVVTAEFLAREKFSTTAAEIGLHPWLAHALETKEDRITQSVVHGFAAVLSGTDSQQVYGAVVAIFLGLLGIATAGWLRVASAPRWIAALAGIGAALASGVTRLQLDGFFSQVATLFVFPSLFGVLWPFAKIDRARTFLPAALLAFLIGAYTEVAVLGIGITASLVVLQKVGAGERIRRFIFIVGTALALNPGYAFRLPAFLMEQWNRVRDPQHLATLFPDGGTWRGWGRLLFDFAGPRFDGVSAIVGVVLVGLGMAALIFQPARRRRALAVALAIPVLTLIALSAASPVPKYPLAKLTIGFTPFWVGLLALGVAEIVRRRRHWQNATVAASILVVAASAATALPQHARVLRNEGTNAVLRSAGMTRARTEATANAPRTFFVAHDDPLVTQWLCYFGRGASVYVGRRHLGDRVVPSETYPFRRLPAAPTDLWWLDPERSGIVPDHEPAIALEIKNARENGETDSGRFYVSGETLRLIFTRSRSAPPIYEAWFDCVLTPMGGVAPCELEFTNGSERPQHLTLTGGGWRRFRVRLHGGENECTLKFLPHGGGADPAASFALLQSLSIESIDSPRMASDPIPAPFVE